MGLNSEKFFSILQIERDGISAMKFETTQMHFLSEVFITVAVVVA